MIHMCFYQFTFKLEIDHECRWVDLSHWHSWIQDTMDEKFDEDDVERERERERESCRFEKGDNREIFCEMEEKG